MSKLLQKKEYQKQTNEILNKNIFCGNIFIKLWRILAVKYMYQ